jgi:hypothetical protein
VSPGGRSRSAAPASCFLVPDGPLPGRVVTPGQVLGTGGTRFTLGREGRRIRREQHGSRADIAQRAVRREPGAQLCRVRAARSSARRRADREAERLRGRGSALAGRVARGARLAHRRGRPVAPSAEGRGHRTRAFPGIYGRGTRRAIDERPRRGSRAAGGDAGRLRSAGLVTTVTASRRLRPHRPPRRHATPPMRSRHRWRDRRRTSRRLCRGRT